MGLTSEDLAEYFSEDGLKDLYHWMRGQTAAMCEGIEWDYATEDYIYTDCGPHGMVIYRHDVQRFIDGEPVID
jgi:hypothetical protein